MFSKQLFLKHRENSLGKYIILNVLPMFSNGASTGIAPIQVSDKKVEIKTQKIFFMLGIHFFLLFVFFNITNKYRDIIDISRAITPPNLLGIDRKIA